MLPYQNPSTLIHKFVITGRNEVGAKVIFLHPSVIHSVHGGVCLSACWDTTPREQTAPPPEQTHTPQEQTPPPRKQTQHTVYERPVRILLECILVYCLFIIVEFLKQCVMTCKLHANGPGCKKIP